MENQKIILGVEKFKEILVNSWQLLPVEKQQELITLGIYPTDHRK